MTSAPPVAPYDPANPPTHINLADHFLEHRIRSGDGDRIALRLADGHATYDEVHRRSIDWARALRARGVRPEERVLIGLPDGLDFVACLFGTLRIGAVAVMTNPQLDEETCRFQIDYVRPRVLVVQGRIGCLFSPCCSEPRRVRVWIPGGRRPQGS